MLLPLQIEKINLSTIRDFGQDLLVHLPKLLGAIAVLVIGWLVIKIVVSLMRKVLKKTKIDTWADKLNEIEIFSNSNFTFKPANFIVYVVKWFLFLLLIVIASDILGLEMVSREIGNLIGYLPQLFSAIAILMIGIYIASIVRNAIQSLFKSVGLTGSNVIGNIVFYAITVIVAITALNQAGINTDIITSNLTIILGALLLAFTIAFGLGSKNIVERLLFGFYSRKNLMVGQKIKVGEVEGIIESLDNISLILKIDNGRLMIPIKEINDNIIELKN